MYEDPMQGQPAPNPQGGGLPGQPRNPATGGYPSRDIAPAPIQPGQISNPDLYARSRQNMDWRRMMRGRMFPGMVGGPGMWGGWEPYGGAMPGQRPTAPLTPEQQKAQDLAGYKDQLQGQKNFGPMYAPAQRPDWMSEDRAGEIAGRINARPADPNGGFTPSMKDFPPRGPMPPWMMPSPWGGWGGSPGYRPMPGPGGPGQSAKPGAPPDATAGGAPSLYQQLRGPTDPNVMYANQVQPAGAGGSASV